MILKQHLFVIGDQERTAVENGNGWFTSVKRTYDHDVLFEGGDQYKPENMDFALTGSSMQRPPRKIDHPLFFDGNRISERGINEATNNIARRHCEANIRKACKSAKVRPGRDLPRSFSKRSKVKITNKITAWVRANLANRHNGVYNFITLTLTSQQRGCDKDFTAMLNVFFTWCRKKYNIKNYLYVLERQENGNIHAHILIDKYVHYPTLNREWCKVLTSNGYTFPSENFVTGEVTQLSPWDALLAHKRSGYYTGTKGYKCARTGRMRKPTRDVNCPSPCDGETVHSLKAVSIYVTKYITKAKETPGAKINTNLWNCSQSISKLWTGAVLNAQNYYHKLREQSLTPRAFTLDNGFTMHLYLLKHYTEVHKKIFECNRYLILQN